MTGIVEFLGTNVVIIPPAVSIPSDNGVTSSNKSLSNFSSESLFKTAAYIAAPNATASSGLIDLLRFLPLKNSLNNYYTFGILVEPPTNTISCT